VRSLPCDFQVWENRRHFRGTPDTIALIDGGLGLIDFKTSPKPYPDHLVALAAHGRLWEENHPDQPLSSYHLLCLPKDGSTFKHHAYADLSQQWELFQLWLAAYRLEKECTLAKTAKAAPKPKPAQAKAEMPRPRRPARVSTAAEVTSFLAKAAAAPKPMPIIERAPLEVPPLIAPRAATMAEILRSYGHVPC
jgi:hypothetical protein